MRLRNILAATAASALIVGAVGTPAHAVTAPSPAKAGSVVAWGDEDNPNARRPSPFPPTSGRCSPWPPTRTRPAWSPSTAGSGSGAAPTHPRWPTRRPGSPTRPPSPSPQQRRRPPHRRAHHRLGRLPLRSARSPPTCAPRRSHSRSAPGTRCAPTAPSPRGATHPLYPTPATGLTDLVDVSASGTHVLALRADGTIVTWGSTASPASSMSPTSAARRSSRSPPAPAYSGVVLDDGSITPGASFLTPADEPHLRWPDPGHEGGRPQPGAHERRRGDRRRRRARLGDGTPR